MISDTSEARLAVAQRLLEANEIESARATTLQVLRIAEDHADLRTQGKALMALAQYDRVSGRFLDAIETSRRAADIFRWDGDVGAEADALAIRAHACSYLAYDEDAVETALFSVKIGGLLPAGPRQVILFNYLGVAYLWSKSFAEAETAFNTAEDLALAHSPRNLMLPRTNLAWLEVMRIFHERYIHGELPRSDILAARLSLCADLFESDEPFDALPGVRSVLQRFGKCAHALLHCWRGEYDLAECWLGKAQDRSGPGNYARVATYVTHWVAAEIHWARKDFAQALREAQRLIDQAATAGFEQMVYIGHLLIIQIHSAQGNHFDSLQQVKRLQARQLQTRADNLKSRDRVAQHVFDSRHVEHQLNLLASDVGKLQQLSIDAYVNSSSEDGGAGIQNHPSLRASRSWDAMMEDNHRLRPSPHSLQGTGALLRPRASQFQLAASLSVLDKLSSGVVLLSGELDVRYVNQAASKILDEAALFKALVPASTSGNRLQLNVRLAHYERRFQLLLKQALETPIQSDAQRLSQALLLPGVDGEPACVVFAAAVATSVDMAPKTAVFKAVVFLHDLQKMSTISPWLLSDIFGLTQAEAKAALQLTRGGTAEDMAGRLAVSVNTFKSQLQAVYQKSGTHRQADLVRVLMALAMR